MKIGRSMDKSLAVFGVMAAVSIPAGVTSVHAIENIVAKKVSTLDGNTENTDANRAMFKAAYMGDVEAFKQALDQGASLKATNKQGQDVLMVALMRSNYNCDIASYILDNEELADQIDFKRRDENGICVKDIVLKRLEKESSSNLSIISKKIDKNRAKQTLEESQGKRRSDTIYDFFEMINANGIEK